MIPIAQQRKYRRGFTLMEMLVAVALSILVAAALMLTTVFVLRSYVAIGNYSDLDKSSRYALDVMSRDIRNADGISMSTYLTNQITMTNADGSSFSYVWNPSDTTFKRYYTNANGTTSVTTLLTNCDILLFTLYTRVPQTNLFFPSTNNPSETKLINVDWRCFRKIYGAPVNTESIQTAQITTRN